MINLKEKLNPEVRKELKNIYATGEINNYKVFLESFGDILVDDKDVLKLQDFLEYKEVKKYLNNSRNFSASRFSNTLKKIAYKLIRNVSTEPILNIIKTIDSEEYIKNLKIYFTPPADYELFDEFETMVIDITEQNPTIINTLFEISEKKVLIDIKNMYKQEFNSTYQVLIKFLEKTIIQFRNVKITELIFNNLISEKFKYFVKIYENKEDFEKEPHSNFFSSLTMILFHGNEETLTNFFYLLFKSKTDILLHITNIKEKKRFILKLLVLLRLIPKELNENFFTFANNYTYNKESPTFFLWETLFESLNKEKTIKYLKFFTSIGFINFYNFYRYEKEILIFLLKHIIILLGDAEINDFPKSLLPLVLKLFLEEKIDRTFLKKRTEYAKWLQEKTKSEILKSVYIKILFFEYIFLFQKRFEKNKNIVLNKFCDTFHQVFCKIIDESMDITLKTEDKVKYYEKLYTISRGEAWRAIFTKFKNESNKIKELSNISESLDIDDIAITQMLNLEEQHFKKYYLKIIEIIKSNPENPDLQIAFVVDYWCRFYFEKAVFFISDALIYLIGNINTYPDKKGNNAFTDGKSIYLPSYISYFQDDPEDTDNNRNLSLFVALALHEAGHIIGGSFKFNLIPLINKYEYPKLLKNIINAFEDYRIESYLKTIKVHQQIDDLLDSMNVYLSYKNDFGIIDTFLLNIYDIAAGYSETIEKINPEKKRLIENILKMNLNSGRFSSLKNAHDYFVDRLKNIDILNPFSSFYIAEEIYQIIKLWPLELIEEAIGFFENGVDINLTENHKDILTAEGLKSLYDKCNSNPLKFYENNEIKVFHELFQEIADKIKNNNQFINSIITPHTINYEVEGTFDTANYTKVDEMGAKRQKEFSLTDGLKNIVDTITGNKKKRTQKKVKVRKIASYSNKTNSKTLIAQCREYEINSINRNFLKANRKYDFIIQKIYSMLNGLFFNINSNMVENSSIDGDVDMERLIEILSDRKNFLEPDFLEYYEENFKSLKVIIGIDISGSTGWSINANDKTTILDIEKHFALIFAKTLKMITDKVDIYAFNSSTSTNIYRAVPLEAVSSLTSDNANRDGDFIRYINYIFSKSNDELKYFFLISDGQPSSINYDGKEALDDTILALKECRKKNIKVIYFNIDSELKDYFYYFKNEVLYAEYFSNPKELIDVIPELIKKIATAIM